MPRAVVPGAGWLLIEKLIGVGGRGICQSPLSTKPLHEHRAAIRADYHMRSQCSSIEALDFAGPVQGRMGDYGGVMSGAMTNDKQEEEGIVEAEDTYPNQPANQPISLRAKAVCLTVGLWGWPLVFAW